MALNATVDECTRSLTKAFYLSANGYEYRRGRACAEIQLLQKENPNKPIWVPCRSKYKNGFPYKKNRSSGK